MTRFDITLGEFIEALMEELKSEGIPEKAAALIVAARLNELIRPPRVEPAVA